MSNTAWFKQLITSIKKHTWWWLGSILSFSFVTRVWRLAYPARYYFDEVYHAVTAKLIALNDPRAYEWWHQPPEAGTAIDWLHPPLAKLTQALSILLWGANSFGWRFSSAIFGVGVIFLVYALARKLRFSKSVSLLAAFLASLDGLLLTMSRIAMNDIHVTFFILLTWWLFWHWKEKSTWPRAILVGLSAGAALAAKWSGIFVVGPIIFDLLLWPLINQIKPQKKTTTAKPGLVLLLSLTVLMPLVYILSYAQMFLQGHDWNHFTDLHQQIWWYQTQLDATHPYQSTPWQWVLDLRPVYAFVEQSGSASSKIYLQGNPLLFWSGLVAVMATTLEVIRYVARLFAISLQTLQTSAKTKISKLKKQLHILLSQLDEQWYLSWLIVAYFSVWIVWINSPRIMFFYHYTPAIPIMAILLAHCLEKFSQQKFGLLTSLAVVSLIAITFVVFYPHWTALPVSSPLLESIYYAFPSWR